MIYYYFVCKRKLWYFCHEINMESGNEDVQLGKILDETSYGRSEKHIQINGEINIDFIKEHRELHEIKKSKSIEQAGIWQVKYYLYYLKKRGVDGLKAKIDYPLLKENVDNLKFSDFCFPLNKDSYDVLRDLAKKGKVMDVIFIDPPYCKEMIPEAMKIIEENKMLSEDGIIVTKIDSIEEIYEGYGSIKLYKSKKYGNTTVCYYKKN